MAIELHSQTLVDTLADAVSQQVLAGVLHPGARVTELDIASSYGVARPTAKAAIERLVQSGILRRSANKTARVAQLSEEEIEDLYLSRIFFEREVVGVLALRAQVPEAAVEALGAMTDSIFSDTYTEMVHADMRFHSALVNGLNNQRLARMFETVIGEAHLCMAQEQSQGALERKRNVDEHAAILDAIRSRDRQNASRLLVEHLSSAAQRLTGRPINLGRWV